MMNNKNYPSDKETFIQSVMEELSKNNSPSYGSYDLLTDVEKQIIDIGFNLYEKRLTQVNSLIGIVDNYRDKYIKMDPDNGY